MNDKRITRKDFIGNGSVCRLLSVRARGVGRACLLRRRMVCSGPMRARLTKDFRFEAAHTLPTLPEGHKCRQMHGHSFKIEISIEGVVDESIGWVYDHKRISEAMRPLLDVLDHGYLNDIEGLESPTIERMAAWFWRKLAPQLPGLAEIVIFETPTARCSFKGEF